MTIHKILGSALLATAALLVGGAAFADEQSDEQLGAQLPQVVHGQLINPAPAPAPAINPDSLMYKAVDAVVNSPVKPTYNPSTGQAGFSYTRTFH